MPKRARAIEEVGQASMVDLKAAVYATEESVRTGDSRDVRAAVQERRRERVRGSDGLGGTHNRGVDHRRMADEAQERDEEQRRANALEHKAAMYERMARGDEDVAKEAAGGLVDFEWKQLTSSGPTGEGRAVCSRCLYPMTTPVCPRCQYQAPREQIARDQEEGSRREKRLATEAAVAEETAQNRSLAAQQKGKRQRALDDRRALLRLKQEVCRTRTP